MISLKSVSKHWEEFEIRNVSIDIPDGEFFVILGPTGAGKTFLLELIGGFHYPSSGNIIIKGKDVTNAPPQKRGAGFVYQDYCLFPHMDVFQNIAYGLKARKQDFSVIEDKVNATAELIGLKELLHRDVETLSGGEKQRVAIARAIIIEPDILLLDEPLSALDARTHDTLLSEIKNLHNKTKITIVYVTHNQTEAFMLADRIAVMQKGEIVQVGTPEEIFRNPKSEFVAKFVGVENLYRGVAKVAGDICRIDVNGVNFFSSNKYEGNVSISIRPEDIIISPEKFRSSARNVLEGKIKEIKDQGALIRVCVDCGIDIVAYITRQSFMDMQLNIGAKVYLIIKAQNVNVF